MAQVESPVDSVNMLYFTTILQQNVCEATQKVRPWGKLPTLLALTFPMCKLTVIHFPQNKQCIIKAGYLPTGT